MKERYKMTSAFDVPDEGQSSNENEQPALEIGDTGDSVDLSDPQMVATDDDEEFDIDDFDDDDFDEEFDDDFEEETDGEYDVVEEFEDEFTFVNPATVQRDTGSEPNIQRKPGSDKKDGHSDKKNGDSDKKDGDSDKKDGDRKKA